MVLIFQGLLRSLVKEWEEELNMLRLLAMEHVKSIEVKVKDNVLLRV
jgi:hypothetical protein